MRRLLLSMVLVLSCGVQPADNFVDGVGALPQGSSGGGGGGAGGGAQMVGDDLPCDVAALVTNKCVTCHSDPPQQSAPFKLLTYADFAAASPSVSDQTVAQRSLTRLKATANPMPPLYAPQATMAEVQAFEAWVTGGLQKGTCKPMDMHPQPPTPTCASDLYWTGGDQGSAGMNPGLACKNCHATREPSRNYAFMGTVFPALHEKDLCYSTNVPAGTTVEILDMGGNVKWTMRPNSVGNFYNTSRSAGFTGPFRARVTANGRTLEMQTAQTNGDCNSCHTVLGDNGAPGRIIFPQNN